MALLFRVVISSAVWSTSSWRQFRIAFLQEASLHTRSLLVGGASAFQPIAPPCCPSLIFMGGSSGSAVSFTQAAQDASCHELLPRSGRLPHLLRTDIGLDRTSLLLPPSLRISRSSQCLQQDHTSTYNCVVVTSSSASLSSSLLLGQSRMGCWLSVVQRLRKPLLPETEIIAPSTHTPSNTHLPQTIGPAQERTARGFNH